MSFISAAEPSVVDLIVDFGLESSTTPLSMEDRSGGPGTSSRRMPPAKRSTSSSAGSRDRAPSGSDASTCSPGGR